MRLTYLPQKCRVGSIGAYVLVDRFPAPSLRTVRTPLGVYGSPPVLDISFDTLQNFRCWIIEAFLPFICPFWNVPAASLRHVSGVTASDFTAIPVDSGFSDYYPGSVAIQT